MIAGENDDMHGVKISAGERDSLLVIQRDAGQLAGVRNIIIIIFSYTQGEFIHFNFICAFLVTWYNLTYSPIP